MKLKCMPVCSSASPGAGKISAGMTSTAARAWLEQRREAAHCGLWQSLMVRPSIETSGSIGYCDNVGRDGQFQLQLSPWLVPASGSAAASVIVTKPACVWPQWGVALTGLAKAYPEVLSAADTAIKLLGEYRTNNKD